MTSTAGVITDVPVLDLTGMATAEELARVREIRDVAVVLVPESLATALMAIPMTDVADIVAVPDGGQAQVHTGSLVTSGEGMGDPSAEDTVLVVTGTLTITSPVQRVAYRRLIVTGLVLAPEGSEGALGGAMTRLTGSVEYYRYAEGQRVVALSGEVDLGAETLANRGGRADDVLLVTGRVVVTGPVREVGFQRVIARGQILVPREDEAQLAPVLSAQGQLAWYGGRPRVFTGDHRFGRAFFELFDEPIGVALLGDVVVDDDVPPELVRDAVTEIALIGTLSASPEVVPVLQYLTTVKHGTIEVRRGHGDDT